jgi:SIR2-like domain
VLGAGISKSCSAPDSRDLAQWMAASFTRPGGEAFSDPLHCQGVADEIVNGSPERSLQLRVDVAAHLDLGTLGASPNETVRALCRVPSRLVVTFNYDLLLEAGSQEQEVDVESLTWRDADRISEIILADEPPEKLIVFHAHGSVNDPYSIILDRRSYSDIQNDQRVEFVWRVLLGRKNLCFLGITLDEPYLITTMGSYPWTRTGHLFISTESTVDDLTMGRASITRARHGVLAVSYPTHDVLEGFAHQLVVDPAPDVVAEPTLRGPATAADPSYVENVLVAESSLDEEDVSLFLARLKVFSEDDLALGGRSVIVGAPGSGKTQLLRYIATKIPKDEFAVLIPLSEVRVRPMAFESLLEQWTQQGEWVGREAPVNEDILRERTYHFFLDALDEVVPASQDAVANVIVGIADAFPQHRFTVTSRPIEAVNRFAADAWLRIRLLPDLRWQERYLQRRGVSWNDLEGRMPELSDIRDLLQLPFFLAAVVDSYHAGTLEGAHDLWDVLRGLVTQALRREEGAGLLPLPAEPARQWLQRLALAMALSGRSSVQSTEAGLVDLPPGLGLTGSVQDVCEALAQRALLETRAGGYVFTHRLISAALLAEALGELDPTTELLDVIAPVRNDVVRGVRQEWIVPLSFLLPRNEPWRLAVAERDALQAARTVSSDAALEVREQAARLLWETYVEWRIWMWNRDLPDFADDARRLARLLRSPDLAGIADEVRVATGHESAQVRANAIEVLSLAGLDVEDEVANMIRKDPEPVVRRHAFLVAERDKYTDLDDDIAERAKSSDDELEVQDATLVAMEMAPDSEVFDLGLSLVLNENARFGALGVLERRLEVSERARLIEKWIQADPDPYSGARTAFDHLLEEVRTSG